MDGEAWWAAVRGVAQSRTQLKQLSSSSSSRPIVNIRIGFWLKGTVIEIISDPCNHLRIKLGQNLGFTNFLNETAFAVGLTSWVLKNADCIN